MTPEQSEYVRRARRQAERASSARWYLLTQVLRAAKIGTRETGQVRGKRPENRKGVVGV
jgi:hypothetical protein